MITRPTIHALVGAAAVAGVVALTACADSGTTGPRDLKASALVRPRPSPDGSTIVYPAPGDRAATFQQLEICKFGSGATIFVEQVQPAPRGPSSNSFTLADGECLVVADHRTDEVMTYTTTETAVDAGFALDSIRVTDLDGAVTLITDSPMWTHTKPSGVGGGWLVEYFNSLVPPPPPPPPPGPNCTNTIGYWKNWDGSGPQPDRVTELLPVTLGDGSGKSVVVANTAVSNAILSHNYAGGHPSNGITKLYSQLLAAKLSIERGADASAVAGVIAAADAFLATYNQADWASLSRSQKNQVNSWKDTLDDYNNGDIGPGHCA